tara:strand:+ start:2257 stop:2928 length:672 start_codon:yes stop_codon:yes gene_type:complete
MKLAPLTLSFLILSLVGCDSARDARKTRFDYSPFSTNNSTTAGNQTDGGGVVVDTGSGSGTGSGTTTIPTEIDHCSWAPDGLNGFSSTSTHLGAYTVCQSKNSQTDLYIQVKNPVTNVQVCLVPTSSSGSSSVYIGEPRCLMLNDNKRVYKVTMLKNRPNFSQLPLNGVMIMKDEQHFYPYPFNQNALSPDAYVFCSQYLAQYGYGGYCESFKSVGAYTYKQF